MTKIIIAWLMTAQKLKLVIDPNNPQFSTIFSSFRVVKLVPDIEQQNKACKCF